MKGKPSLWRGRWARVIALGVAVALAPLPLAAADQNTPAAKPGIQASVQKAVSTVRLADPAKAPQRSQDQAGGPDLQSSSFFKTPAGIAVLVVMAAGTGYAIYSTSHDRVKSQVR